jgi:hypothetical protein
VLFVNLGYLTVKLRSHTWSFYGFRAIYALNSTDLAKCTITTFYLDGHQDKFSNPSFPDLAEWNISNQFPIYFQAKFRLDPAVFLAGFKRRGRSTKFPIAVFL